MPVSERPTWQLAFDCSACGACCRLLNCAHFDEQSNLCTIYERRPDVCRIGYGRPAQMPPEQYLSLTRQACTALQALDKTRDDT